MKKIIFISIFLSLIVTSYSQEDNKKKKIYSMSDFVTIKISTGYTIHGTHSITLQREGLIYWYISSLGDSPFDSIKEESKFIPFTELDKSKVFEIIRYVYEKKMYEMQSQPRTCSYYDSTKQTEIQIIYPNTRPIVLTFIVHDQFLYTGFNYRICDKKVDAFIRMINELIPKEDREEFGIRLRCD